MKKSVVYLIILFVCFAFSSFEIYSQDSIIFEEFVPKIEKNVDKYENSIGLRYSNISGQGISIGRRFFDDFTIIFTGMIQYDETVRWEDQTKSKIEFEQSDILYNYGFEFQLDILESNTTKIVTFLGLYKKIDTNKDTSYKIVDDIFAVGGGFGFLWYVHKNLNFELGFGYKFERNDKEENKKPSLTQETGVGANCGIRFNF